MTLVSGPINGHEALVPAPGPLLGIFASKTELRESNQSLELKGQVLDENNAISSYKVLNKL